MSPFRKIFAKWFGRKAVEPPLSVNSAAHARYREWIDALVRDEIIVQINMLNREISRLRRNKKRHSHLVARRDALIKEIGQ